MPKGKKRKKTSGSRRKMGAMALTTTNPIVQYAPIVLGYVLAPKINPMIDKLTGDKIDQKIVGVLQGGLGAMLTFKKGGKTSGAMAIGQKVVGGVLLGSGARRLMTSFGIGSVGPYGAVPVIAGYGKVPVIGNAKVNRVAGYNPHGTVGSYRVPVMAGVGSGGSDCMD